MTPPTIILAAPAGASTFVARNGTPYAVSATGTITIPSSELADAMKGGFLITGASLPAAAAIADTQLATISTEGKVSASAEAQTSKLLGKLLGANFNITTDQAIAIAGLNGGGYVVDAVLVTNPSIALDTAAGGVYSAASKGGVAIVAAGQAYAAAVVAADLVRATIAAAGLAKVFTAATLYLALTTPQGASATADVYIFGRPLA